MNCDIIDSCGISEGIMTHKVADLGIPSDCDIMDTRWHLWGIRMNYDIVYTRWTVLMHFGIWEKVWNFVCSKMWESGRW